MNTGRTLFTAAAARESAAQAYPQKALAWLATPYTKYPHGLDVAFVHAAEIAADLLSAGVTVYSPIVHSHPLSTHSNGKIDPLDQDFWRRCNETMLELCEVLIIAHMEGWRESVGIKHEIKTFEKAGKKIFDLDPESFVMVQRR